MTEAKQACSEQIYRPSTNWYYYAQCKKPAKIEKNGVWFCSIHDPDAKKRHGEKLQARWDAETKARHLEYDIKSAEKKVVEAARSLSTVWFNGYCPDVAIQNLLEAVAHLENLYTQRVASS